VNDVHSIFQSTEFFFKQSVVYAKMNEFRVGHLAERFIGCVVDHNDFLSGPD
jgi:hypothetical protein